MDGYLGSEACRANYDRWFAEVTAETDGVPVSTDTELEAALDAELARRPPGRPAPSSAASSSGDGRQVEEAASTGDGEVFKCETDAA